MCSSEKKKEINPTACKTHSQTLNNKRSVCVHFIFKKKKQKEEVVVVVAEVKGRGGGVLKRCETQNWNNRGSMVESCVRSKTNTEKKQMQPDYKLKDIVFASLYARKLGKCASDCIQLSSFIFFRLCMSIGSYYFVRNTSKITSRCVENFEE